MKKLTCNELNGQDCRFIAAGSADAEIKQAILAHSIKEHREMMEEMTRQERQEASEKIDELLAEQC